MGTTAKQALYRIGELITEQNVPCTGQTVLSYMQDVYKSFIPVASFLLSTQTDYTYDQSGTNSLFTTKVFQYNSPNHNYPTLSFSTKNFGQIKGTITLYPKDFPYSVNPTGLSSAALAVNNMAVNNIVSVPIEQVSFIAPCITNPCLTAPAYSSFLLLGSTVGTYKVQTATAGNQIIVPVTKTAISLNRATWSSYTMSNRTTGGTDPFSANPSTFQNYLSNYAANSNVFVTDQVNDIGRTLQSHSQYDIASSSIFGYKSELPIATVVGGSYNQIAYTSFEEANSGGWVHSSFAVATDALSGKSYYQGSTSSITTSTQMPSLSGTNKYKISFYARSASGGSILVSFGTGVSQSVTIPAGTAWQYYTVYLNPSASAIASLAPSSTSMQIDELRLHPADAKMTTKCYQPLVGVITVLDVNSVPSYYEYDILGRLKNIRNMDGNILKHNDFHYKY
jgi:hypothetical protein